MKRITYFCVIITIFLSLGLGTMSSQSRANTKGDLNFIEKKLNITTVTKAQAIMVQQLTEGRHNINYLIEGNINDYEITDEVISKVSKQDLFLYTGSGYESWINEFIYKLDKKHLGIIDLSRGTKNKANNPYYFLGYDQYKISLYNVKIALQDRDPKNRGFYEERYNALTREVDEKINKKIAEYNSLVENENIIYLSNNKDYEYFFDFLQLNINYINKENYNEVISSYIDSEANIIIFTTVEEKEKFDFTEFSIEPIVFYDTTNTKSYEQNIINNISVILDEIIKIKS